MATRFAVFFPFLVRDIFFFPFEKRGPPPPRCQQSTRCVSASHPKVTSSLAVETRTAKCLVHVSAPCLGSSSFLYVVTHAVPPAVSHMVSLELLTALVDMASLPARAGSDAM